MIFTTYFFSYSTNKTELPCANSMYSQCLNCFSYLLPAVWRMATTGTNIYPGCFPATMSHSNEASTTDKSASQSNHATRNPEPSASTRAQSSCTNAESACTPGNAASKNSHFVDNQPIFARRIGEETRAKDGVAQGYLLARAKPDYRG